MKINFTTGLVIVSLFLASVANAQSSAVQNALKDVQGQVQDLVTAKDEGQKDDLNLRIETFKKVVDFSISEAKDLKIKLLALDKLSKETMLWRDSIISSVNQAVDYYENQKESLDDVSKINLETIKKIASDFKEWRDKNYVAAVGVADSYLLILQEQKAVETATKRSERIRKDVLNLQKAKIKGVAKLQEMLGNADKKINEAADLNKEAGNLFWNQYILPIAMQGVENETTTTSSAPAATSTVMNAPLFGTSTATSSTSSPANATSSPIFQPSSIKDLVESSLSKIKETYQIFIEMSNLVRKLL